MSREIKFRAWDKRYEVIEEVTDLEFFNTGKGTLTTIEAFGNLRNSNLSDVELMQYTGLKDQNYIEIYEGDIIEVDGETSVIKSEPGGFIISGLPLVEVSNYGMKVIGNIHENPELLECGEE